jgi:hypothetical protein
MEGMHVPVYRAEKVVRDRKYAKVRILNCRGYRSCAANALKATQNSKGNTICDHSVDVGNRRKKKQAHSP